MNAIEALGAATGPGSRVLGVFSFLLAVAVLAGFLTPISGILNSSSFLVAGFHLLVAKDGSGSPLSLFVLAVISAALALLGPGAYSLDARMFGRREILIPRRKP